MDADIRCLVIGDKVVAAMKRQGKEGEFRSNLHRGGAATLIVTPVGESILIDSGYPDYNGRDRDRILDTLKNEAKLDHLPEDYDPSRRANAVKYTREKDKITTGVLYHVETPSLIDRLDDIKERAMAGNGTPSTKDMLSSFYPSF